jgi:DinB superfamily
MSTAATPDLSYPIGKFKYAGPYTEEQRHHFINEIAAAPARMREAVHNLRESQLDTPYRPGGWTVKQVVHHVPDSHMNAYIRFKLALTEPNPMVKTYDEKQWALLPDVEAVPIETSLVLLEAVHHRWVAVLRAMTPEQFEYKLKHPELGEVNLDRYLGMYAWHGRHHVAHITSLRKRMGW